MEVHHPAHPVSPEARKKWTHYLWEFLMLFLAVTLGFFVENQRERIVERHRLHRFAGQLLRGLEKDTATQNQVLELLKDKEKIVDSLLYFLSLPKDDAYKWTGVYHTLFYLENPFRYSYQKPVFEQISNSGSLRLFTDDALIDSLMDYEYNGVLVEWQTDALVSYITQTVTPFLNLHFDKNLIAQRFDTHIKKPGWDMLQVGNSIPGDFLKDVAGWKSVFENIVITAREKQELPYLNIVEQRDRAVGLIALLKREFDLK